MKNLILLGSRVLLSPPEIKKSTITLSPELEKEMEKKEMEKWYSLEVCAIGDEVKNITVGDKVYVNPIFLSNAEIVKLDEKVMILVRAADVSIIWK